MHTRSADALALSTELGSGPAFFRSSSRSFFIGVLRQPTAMEQLAAKELEAAYCKKSLQQELAAAYCEEESLQQELAAAYCEEESLQQELEATYCEETNFQQNEHRAAYFLGQTKARELQLHIAQLCQQAFAHKSLQQNELTFLARRRPESVSLTLRSFAATMWHRIACSRRSLEQLTCLARRRPDSISFPLRSFAN